jgi:predicted phage terminase large subunit-like protein
VHQQVGQPSPQAQGALSLTQVFNAATVLPREHVVVRPLLPEAVIVERAAAGFGIIDRLSAELSIVPLVPRGSKEQRAAAVCSLVNGGQVEFPQQAPWLGALLEELASFPLGRTKDQVDALVHALSYLARPSEFAPVRVEGAMLMTAQQLEEELEYLHDNGGPLECFELGLPTRRLLG